MDAKTAAFIRVGIVREINTRVALGEAPLSCWIDLDEEMEPPMICKVQRSLNVNGDRMLIYSQDRRSIWFEGTLTDDVAEIMGADIKCFVEARVVAGRGFVVESRLDRREWPSW